MIGATLQFFQLLPMATTLLLIGPRSSPATDEIVAVVVGEA